MREWQNVKLGDLCLKIGSGATPRGGKESYKESGIAFIRSQNVLDFSFSKEGLAYISEGQAAQLDNVAVQSGDVLVNITGDSVARVCMVPDEYLPARVNQHVAIIRSNAKKADKNYILYCLQYYKDHLLSISSSGGTRNALTKKMLEELLISLPSLDTQRELGEILNVFDKKIDLNNKIVCCLEQMAQAIFKSWFVDFEPWGGIIPKNWRKVTLDDVIWIKHGYAFKGKYFCDEKTDFLLVTPGNFSIGGGFQEKPKYYNGQIPKDYILKKDDVIVTMTDLSKEGDTLGYSALVPENEKYLHNQRIGLVSVKTDAPLKEYIYWLMRTREYQRFIVNHASGSTVKHTSPKTILTYPFVMPDNHTLQTISNTLRIINQRVSLNNAESERLATLRDALLPQLMSGEHSVSKFRR